MAVHDRRNNVVMIKKMRIFKCKSKTAQLAAGHHIMPMFDRFPGPFYAGESAF